jgi:hypothetical protein
MATPTTIDDGVHLSQLYTLLGWSSLPIVN